MAKKHMDQDYFRSMIFGIEDALVSTTGVVAGVSAGSHDREFVILAGIVTVAVEAMSMGAGQYLSEKAVQEMRGKKQQSESAGVSAVIMLVSYAVAGTVPVLPFLFVGSIAAIISSVSLALVGLYVLGYVKGRYLHIPATRSAVEMMVVGGVAALVGVLVGHLLQV